MRAGEVDFIMGSDTLDANSYLELSQVEGITGVISDFNFVTEFIALNDEVAPLDDLNVRTAIQMAIDKESIAQNIYSGLRTKADSVMPADMPTAPPRCPPRTTTWMGRLPCWRTPAGSIPMGTASGRRPERLRTSEHRSMYSYVRLSIDRCTATYV